MHPTRIAAVAIASTAMVAGVASAAVAGHGSGDGSVAPTSTQVKPHAVTPNVAVSAGHTLKNTYLSQGSVGGQAVTSGFQPVDGVTTIKCVKKCYIDGDEAVQQASSATSNLFALSLRVDGVDQTSPYLGYAPTTFGGSTWHTVSTQLAPGTHTVQTVIYTAQGTTLYNYSNTYRVFSP